jgi:hypothetical protein
VFGLKIA